ncbi:hypothetical protein DU508_05140 [Pedobacter chinensis]|uniref:Uncharacterized protein n=1 Tax=Pedobacter chinensis TaxID=2282421 RepID=A0A369Q5W8_9SPHI|nr:hypothetical protein [Pedobacter chinensis]RDC58319.1 hypothetical protein DU508_05140 [Pedobacter chinensis]
MVQTNYRQFPSLQGEGQQKRTNTTSINRERCSERLFNYCSDGKNLSPSSPLLEERGRGAESKVFKIWFKPITANFPLFKERDSKKEQTPLPLIGRGVVSDCLIIVAMEKTSPLHALSLKRRGEGQKMQSF